MLIYSKKIIRFIAEIKHAIKRILSVEVGLRVHGERFYDKSERYSYPIKVVVYNNKKMLGYFASDFIELGFHEMLMHAKKEELHNIIRHEIAHYLIDIQYGPFTQSHGAEFKAMCQSFGWGEEVYRATSCLDDGSTIPHPEESHVLRRVKKLMALATSSNPNEAEQAMLKSRELLLKHNIDSYHVDDDEEKVFLKRVLKQKKEDAKMRSIASVLDTLFVNTVYSRINGFIYLEIVGCSVNIEIAEYVANFLEIELDRLWDQAKKQFVGLKGMVAKNSFFFGIAKGYCNKVLALKRTYSKDESQAMTVIEKKLMDAKSMVYPRLTNSKSNGCFCPVSSALGEQVGKSLTINPGLAVAPTHSGAYLT